MTRAGFDSQLARLSVLKGVPGDNDGHWEALRDVPAGIFEAAIGHALKTREWFPVPAELRADADKVAPRVVDQPPDEDRSEVLAQPLAITVPGAGTVLPVTRIWNYYCDTCSDLGWESMWCGDRVVGDGAARREIAKPWQPSRHCDRCGEHGSHEWVRPCACLDTNPALVKKREAQRKYAEEPQRVR